MNPYSVGYSMGIDMARNVPRAEIRKQLGEGKAPAPLEPREARVALRMLGMYVTSQLLVQGVVDGYNGALARMVTVAQAQLGRKELMDELTNFK